MPTQVVMPQLGEGVIEGTITKWLKAKGDSVEEFEPLLEINTDKVDTEIPSPETGVLMDILVPEGTIVEVGTVLALISGQSEAPAEKQAIQAITDPAEQVPIPGQKPVATPAPGRDRELGFISPVVARIASEHNVDLFQVKGSGQGGRITKKDILAYIDQRESQVPPAIVKPPVVEPVQPAPALSTIPEPSRASVPSVASGLEISAEVIPLTPVRRSIAEHMVSSKHTSPHATAITEVDLSQVVAHRQANKAAYQRDGVNLTFTAYFVTATIAALKAYPIVNSSWSAEGIVIHPQINIGMATSLGEEGLIVPVIKNADQLSLLGLARTINDLANRARAKKLQPDEVKAGTFTITNHGVTGSLFATPIINQPQCAILGVGAIQKRVVVVSNEVHGDTIAIRPMAYIGLTFDHRILDGAVTDYFLAKVVESLQGW